MIEHAESYIVMAGMISCGSILLSISALRKIEGIERELVDMSRKIESLKSDLIG